MSIEVVPEPQASTLLLNTFCVTAQRSPELLQRLQRLGLGTVTLSNAVIVFNTGYYKYALIVSVGDCVRLTVSNTDEPGQYHRVHEFQTTYPSLSRLLGEAVHRIRDHLNQHGSRALGYIKGSHGG